MSLFVVLVLVVAHASVRATDAYDEGSAREELESSAHRLPGPHRGRARDRRTTACCSRRSRTLAASSLSSRRPIGFAGGGVQWGPLTTIALELEPGEMDDGLDNDGDGFADEGRVVWTEAPGQPSERSVVLGQGVREYLQGETPNAADDNGNVLLDERGLSFASQDDVLTVRLTCQRLDDGGRVMTKTVQTSIHRAELEGG